MTQVADVMTRDVHTMTPDDSVVMAARVMAQMDVGMVPVCDDGCLVGIVTDRDIVLRGVTKGGDLGGTLLGEVMSAASESCAEDQSLEDVIQQMQQSQVRRLPVVDEARHVIGVISLGDVAVKYDASEAGEALEAISEPSEPARPELPADAEGVPSSARLPADIDGVPVPAQWSA